MKKNNISQFFRFFITSILLLLILFISSCTPSKKFLQRRNIHIKDNNIVKILLMKTKNKITVASKTRLKIIDIKSSKIIYDSKNVKLTIRPNRISNPILVESWDSPIFINGKPYRGSIKIIKRVGKLFVINKLKMDEYLYGVVPSEIPASWDFQVLKAQAVAARTYAYYHILKKKNKSIYDLDASTNFQMYKGMIAEKPSTKKAVFQTSGEVMLYQYEPILAYFHSTSGGYTIDDKYVWTKNDLPYLVSVKSQFCNESPHFRWQSKLSYFEIRKKLQKKYRNIGEIRKLYFTRNQGRVTTILVKHSQGDIKISGNHFRLLFSPKILKSTYFTTKRIKYGLIFNGRGWGHGVGMCQWGAKGMADR
jgi:stage II sporulation protein D (peptidoglycan lytic transglycosylase)